MEKENDLIRWWNRLRIEMLKQQGGAQVFALLEREVLQLGFEYYAYAVRHLTPFTRPKTEIHGSYPERWLEHYQEQNYAAVDPSILSGLRSTEMVLWNDALFENSRKLWLEARDWVCASAPRCRFAATITRCGYCPWPGARILFRGLKATRFNCACAASSNR
ncbi:hypothetical protein HBO24_27190 [Pseudomonas sp. WS 5410]|nr:autoinducer binding domain-containing protein [Pseudomonas sp. WS 5410]NMY23930.1 hypothetical protein [Pseudomonas sp. WS 5410]